MTAHPHRVRRARPLLRAVALGLGLLVAPVLLTGCGKKDTTLQGAVILPEPDVSDLSLPNAVTGDAFTIRAAPDHVLLMYFGFTHCPDICPTTLAHVKAALARLSKAQAERVDLAFATVDPQRDTGDILQPYVRSFVADATALRTTDDSVLKPVADRFGVQYLVAKNAAGEIEVSHTGTLYAVDDTGKLVDQFLFDADPEEASKIAHDLKILLDR